MELDLLTKINRNILDYELVDWKKEFVDNIILS